MGLVLLFLIFLGWKVYKSTRSRKGKWGINVNPPKKWRETGVLRNVRCPVCGNDLDNFRKPKNISEVLWGGWTCGKCGASLNKWGELRKEENSEDEV